MSYAQRQGERDREYEVAWAVMSEEQKAEMKSAGIDGPLVYHASVPRHLDDDEFDPLENAPSEESHEAESSFLANAILRVLYLLTQSQHPRLRLSAEILAAIIARTEDKSQAAIARRHGLTRAAVNKHFQTMRRSPHLCGLEIYVFGGRAEASESARKRALRVHAERKQTLCKPPTPQTPKLSQFLTKLKAA